MYIMRPGSFNRQRHTHAVINTRVPDKRTVIIIRQLRKDVKQTCTNKTQLYYKQLIENLLK